MDIAVIGSGGWGVAISILLHNNGHNVALWSHTSEETQDLYKTRISPRLPGVKLPDGIVCTDDNCIAADKDLIVLAPPSFAMRQTVQAIAPHVNKKSIIVSLTKGIEYSTGMRMSQIASEKLGDMVVALSGPSHAEEVSRNIPTGVVAASDSQYASKLVQNAFMNDSFRVYTGDDIIGVELGAALKNVIAVCAGMCDGIGCGDNTKALLITRGLEEIARLGMAMGAKRETLSGLAGMGDLIVTCTSMHSRNRRAGILIGKGYTAQEAMQSVGAVVEGYYAAKSAKELALRVGVEMPISEAAYQIMYEQAKPEEIITDLMRRKQTPEHKF